MHALAILVPYRQSEVCSLVHAIRVEKAIRNLTYTPYSGRKATRTDLDFQIYKLQVYR